MAVAVPRLAGDLETVVRQSVSCATLWTEPLIRGNWLRAGMHLDGRRFQTKHAGDRCYRLGEWLT